MSEEKFWLCVCGMVLSFIAVLVLCITFNAHWKRDKGEKAVRVEREALKLALEALGWADGWRPQGLKDKAIAAIKEALAQPVKEPVAFAGIEIWVGNARIAKYLTQTELHYARDPWMLMQYSAEMCISKLKEKNNGT